MIRLMLVDDSKFMRTFTKNLITENPELQVVKEAKNGEEALTALSNDVDVVLLDIEMPKLNGLQVLEKWREENKNVPVIMFSSLTKSGAEETMRALDLGAFDFVEKPHNPILLSQKRDEIIEKIKAAHRHFSRNIPFSSYGGAKIKATPFPLTLPPDFKESPRSTTSTKVENLILIGCSTGGPKALKEIIPMFPRDLNAAILIVQHMPRGGYIQSLAETLDKTSSVQVWEAKNGQTLQNGNVYLAPGGMQMKINLSGNLVLTEDPPENGHAPSVDYLFREVYKKAGGYHIMPVVLTGMGGDGAKSSALLSKAGIETVIEAEETCVVFGMPKKVIETGAKYCSLPLHYIPEHLLKKLR